MNFHQVSANAIQKIKFDDIDEQPLESQEEAKIVLDPEVKEETKVPLEDDSMDCIEKPATEDADIFKQNPTENTTDVSDQVQLDIINDSTRDAKDLAPRGRKLGSGRKHQVSEVKPVETNKYVEDALHSVVKDEPIDIGKRKRARIPKDLSDPKYLEPFKFGWKRALVYRAIVEPVRGTTADIRSKREVAEHLKNKELSIENFSFYQLAIGLDDPEKEIIKDSRGLKSHDSFVKQVTAKSLKSSSSSSSSTRIPKLSSPKLSSPKLVSPKLDSPKPSISKVVSPKLTPAKVSSPKPVVSKITSPKLGSSKLPASKLAIPKLASPKVSSPQLPSLRLGRIPGSGKKARLNKTADSPPKNRSLRTKKNVKAITDSSTYSTPLSCVGAQIGVEGECIICCEHPIDAILYKCGHMCMCYECALQQWRGKGNGHCPICRAVIRDVIRTYRS